MSSLFELSELLPLNADDEPAEATPAPIPPPDRLHPRKALAEAALTTILTPALRSALAAKAQLVVIQAPSAGWAQAMADAMVGAFPQCVTKALTEIKRSGSSGSAGKDHLADLADGDTVVIVTQDAETHVPPSLQGAVDLTAILPSITARLVRKAAEASLGTTARRLRDEDLAGLDFEEIAAALRPGSTGGEVVRRLRRARAAKAAPATNLLRTPRLEEIPLAGAVRTWSLQIVDDLHQVEAGELDPSAIPAAVLEGPPGTGKTLIAAALAKSVGWRFVSTSLGRWFGTSDGHLGGVSKACTAFFDEMLASDRTIGFIDELDALPDRAALAPHDREWWSSVITLVLLQVDRVRKSGKQVLLLAATNYYDRLDAALIRPGRLERRVPVLPPRTETELAVIFAYYLAGEFGTETCLRAARLTRGATPAMVEGWVRSARALARAEGRPMTETDLLATIAPPDDRSPSELRVAALHEAGHAVVARRLGIRVSEVSIIGDDGIGGMTRTERGGALPTRQSVEDTVTVIMAGRAADIVLAGAAHAGARSDLATATRLLGDAMTAHGLYDTLVHVSLGDGAAAVRQSPALAVAVDLELKRLLARAIAIVEAEADLTHRLADELLRRRILTGDEIGQVLEHPSSNRADGGTPPRPAASSTSSVVVVGKTANPEGQDADLPAL